MTLAAGRLPPETIAANFAELTPPLTAHEALVAADRCYFCYDAPCVAACPTAIDIPMFIRQIAAGRPRQAARTIFDANILGGMCARVCPVETLCEEACVREVAEGEPVQIARLQRYATDAQMPHGQPYVRAAATGRTVGVVGAGPAGLAAAHRLALHGHDVVVYDARPKGGGLNEYGIAAYKTVGDFAQAELDWLLAIGGIELRRGQALGRDVALDELRARHDAVVLAMGLPGVNAFGVEGSDLPGVASAVDFIARVRQDDRATIPVGRDVVVIGGGMTAIDAAVQARLLGAETVTIAYRRSRAEMGASRWEQDLATSKGVTIRDRLRPVRVVANGAGLAIELEYTRLGDAGLQGTGETVRLPADQVLVAIGQTLEGIPQGLAVDRGRIAVDAAGRTSVAGIWAAGDCTNAGDDLTVTAVAQGRDAAESIHAALSRDMPRRASA
jgi:dihydropyrimidine dehydrogenase (NAD+) subunit PreT